MKRLLLFLGGGLLLLLLLLVALAFNSGVQTWAARKVLTDLPGVKAEIGRVSAGLSRIEIENLRWNQPDLELTLPRATIELPLLSALRQKIELKNLTAKDWKLRFTGQSAPAASPAEKQPASDAGQAFSGFLEMIKLPVDLSVDRVDLAGEIVFPAAKPGGHDGRAQITVQGGGLAAAQTGRFEIEGQVQLSDPAAPINRAIKKTELLVSMSSPRDIYRIKLTSRTEASGPRLPGGTALLLDATLQPSTATLAPDEYVEEFSLLLHSPEKPEEKILSLTGRFSKKDQLLSGEWLSNARDANLAPFALGLNLPEFALQGSGRFQTSTDFKQSKLDGQLTGRVAQLQRLAPDAPDLGALNLGFSFALSQQDRLINVTQLSAKLGGQLPLFDVEVLQHLQCNLAQGTVSTPKPESDIMRLQVHDVPLAWLKPYLPPSLALTGSSVRGEFFAQVRDSGVRLTARQPVLVGPLSAAQDGQPLLEKLQLSFSPAVIYTPEAWQIEIPDLVAASPVGTVARLQLKAGQLTKEKAQPIKATGSYDLALGPLLSQPALKNLAALTSGQAQGDFTANLTSELTSLAAKLHLKQLVASDQNALPEVASELRADLKPDGSLTARAPVVITKDTRRSALNASVDLQAAATTKKIKAEIAAETLHIPDLQLFAALAPSSPPSSQSSSDSSSLPPSSSPSPSLPPPPPWAGIEGTLKFTAQQIVYSEELKPTDVSAEVDITAAALALKRFYLKVAADSEINATGKLTHDAKSKQPYGLTADLSTTNFDPAPLLKSNDPKIPPTVRGKFDIKGQLTSRAETLEALSTQAAADLSLDSRGGEFNGFAPTFATRVGGGTTKAVSKLSGLVGLAGALSGNNKVAEEAVRAKAYADLVQMLIQIPYDQLRIVVKQQPGEAAEIKEFTLLSPNLRLLATGKVASQAGVNWYSRALSLQTQLAARGEMAECLRILGKLQHTPDGLGYLPFEKLFQLDGTPSQIGASALLSLLN